MTAEPTLEVLVVGVGGQGVLTAAQVLASAAHRAGRQVSVGQLHGMSQRGGTVECTVRFGAVHTSYLVDRAADVVLGFELLETLRAAHWIDSHTEVVTGLSRILPHGVVAGSASYPDSAEIVRELARRAARVVTLDAAALARQAGSARAVNAAMLGALAGVGVIPLAPELVLDALCERCSLEFAAANRRAFELGIAATQPRSTLESAET